MLRALGSHVNLRVNELQAIGSHVNLRIDAEDKNSQIEGVQIKVLET